MALMCAWASQSEGGGVDGQPGDQTGNEVKRGPWYQFGQNQVFRFKDRNKARRAAALIGACADNDMIGYGQSDRLTLYQEWSAANWNVNGITQPCNCDCSSLIAAVVNAVGIQVPPYLTTYSMQAGLMATHEFEEFTSAQYLNSDTLLAAGDIVNNSSSHVIMVTADVQPSPTGGTSPAAVLFAMAAKKRKNDIGRYDRHFRGLW